MPRLAMVWVFLGMTSITTRCIAAVAERSDRKQESIMELSVKPKYIEFKLRMATVVRKTSVAVLAPFLVLRGYNTIDTHCHLAENE